MVSLTAQRFNLRFFFTGANKNETEKIHVNQSFMNLGFQHVGFQGVSVGHFSGVVGQKMDGAWRWCKLSP